MNFDCIYHPLIIINCSFYAFNFGAHRIGIALLLVVVVVVMLLLLVVVLLLMLLFLTSYILINDPIKYTCISVVCLSK